MRANAFAARVHLRGATLWLTFGSFFLGNDFLGACPKFRGMCGDAMNMRACLGGRYAGELAYDSAAAGAFGFGSLRYGYFCLLFQA